MTDKTTSKGQAGKAGQDAILNSLLQELKQDRESRDQQLGAMVQEIRQGFTAVLEDSYSRDSQRDRDFEQLVASLGKAFSRVELTTREREKHSEKILADLSQSIILDHEILQKEVQEQEKLQELKLKNLDKVQKQEVRRTRLIAVPGFILGFLALIYMFYTVHVMEVAMTSMSHDIKEMKVSMRDMSQNTRAMTVNTGRMTRDMNVMTRNVAPAMSGMRRMMPWSP